MKDENEIIYLTNKWCRDNIDKHFLSSKIKSNDDHWFAIIGIMGNVYAKSGIYLYGQKKIYDLLTNIHSKKKSEISWNKIKDTYHLAKTNEDLCFYH